MSNTNLDVSVDASDNKKKEFSLEDLAVANDFATPEKQEARAFLRERFLRVMTGIVGKKLFFHH